MSKPIFQVIDDLPTSNMTTRVLHVLDWVAPGSWTNTVGFENTITTLTGETDQDMIQKIGERAVELYNDRSQGYQRALWLYEKVDSVQGMAGKVALVNKIGESIGFLSFLDRITPKADTVQVIDLSIKVIVELVAFCQLNGIPGDSVGNFLESLADYQDEGLMRMAALVCLDGLIPLGPEFIDKILSMLSGTGISQLEENERYQNVKALIPGNSSGEQLGFIQQSVGSVTDWMKNFVSGRGIAQNNVVQSLNGVLQGAESKLDYVAAFLDITTNYFEHTGAQSVARSLILRAVNEI